MSKFLADPPIFTKIAPNSATKIGPRIGPDRVPGERFRFLLYTTAPMARPSDSQAGIQQLTQAEQQAQAIVAKAKLGTISHSRLRSGLGLDDRPPV